MMANRNVVAAVSLCLLLSTFRSAAAADKGPPQVKPPLAGLIDMGDIGFHRQDGGRAEPHADNLRRFPGTLGGVVINITWEQLEPEQGAALKTEAVDRVLADIRAYNAANPQRPAGARLRVWPGPNAPGWAKHLGGPPVALLHKDRRMTVGRFWAKPYRDAWRDLQHRLAARYDAEPLVREVTNTSGSSVTDEPVLLPAEPESIANLRAAGFTDEQFRACLTGSPADYAGWATTRVELICNPYRSIDAGRPRPDPAFTLALMRGWRQALGPRGILGNHSLQQPVADHLVPIYEEMKRLGPPIALQTHSPKGLDWDGAIRTGLDHKAGAIELWPGTQFGGFTTKDPQTLRRWAGLFRADGGD